MKQKIQRILSVILTLCLILSLAPTVSAASTIPVTVTSSFKKSKYYTAANNAYNPYRNASDAEKFVRMALSQKGYKGSSKTGDYDGVGSGSGMFTEYGKWRNKDRNNWCTTFVSWCAAAAGLSKNVITKGDGFAGYWRSKGTKYVSQY